MVANVIAERLALAGVEAGKVDIAPLAAFLSLMAKWNRHINLTALSVDPPTAEAVDRLIVEPVLAAQLVERAPMAILDIGSGGGSPAIPFRLQFQNSSLTMVESRSKKCAFLREAVRSMEIQGSRVLETRFEDVADGGSASGGSSKADFVTVRAVRLDEVALRVVKALASPDAVVLRFTSDQADVPGETFGLRLFSERPLLASTRSSIQLFHVEH